MHIHASPSHPTTHTPQHTHTRMQAHTRTQAYIHADFPSEKQTKTKKLTKLSEVMLTGFINFISTVLRIMGCSPYPASYKTIYIIKI